MKRSVREGAVQISNQQRELVYIQAFKLFFTMGTCVYLVAKHEGVAMSSKFFKLGNKMGDRTRRFYDAKIQKSL